MPTTPSIKPVRRTPSADPPSRDRPVRLVARDMAAAESLIPHAHGWGQFTYALDGVLRVTVGNNAWIVPPLRAIWIPSDLVHETATLEQARLRALYVHADVTPFHDGECRVLDVSPLLRELIVAFTQTREGEPREAMLSALIVDEIGRSPTLPMRIALPTDKRLKLLCEALIADPSSSLGLDEWAQRVGASARTLARLFERDLGMRFGQWRQQVRLAHAASLISRGVALSQVASELGYASQSAFSAMFRKTFGQSPSAFFARREHS